MTIQVVPTFADPFYTQTSALEGQVFHLSFSYNQREDRWYLSIADASGVDIYNGVKLMCKRTLLRTCVDPRRPAGDFRVFDKTGSLEPPGLNDLVAGGRCVLHYVSSDIIAQCRQPGGLDAFLATLASNTQTGTASTYGQQ